MKETITHLVRKSGYRKNSENVLDKIELTTYETSKIKMTYAEYLEFKKWHYIKIWMMISKI